MHKTEFIGKLSNMLTQKGTWLDAEEVKKINSWLDILIEFKEAIAVKNALEELTNTEDGTTGE